MDDEDASREDLVTIGVTEEGNQILEKILERKWFATDMAAFRAVVAFGLANQIEPTSNGRFQTKWNVGSLDRNGEFLDVVTMFYDGQRPWDFVRRVGDAALKALKPDLERADVPSEIFARFSSR